MAFFGLTSLGVADPIKDMTAVHVYHFHEIPQEKYEACFNKYLIGSSHAALMLEVDGSNNILRASLGDMLRELLGRQPRKHELEAWFTFLDYDRSAVMPREEFELAIEGLREVSACPAKASTYNSFAQYHADWLRHARVEYERQHACRMPMTSSQEVGWHNIKPGPQHHKHHLNATDVTKREGQTAASYYGHFLS